MKLSGTKIRVDICLAGAYLFDQRRFYKTENRVYNWWKANIEFLTLSLNLLENESSANLVADLRISISLVLWLKRVVSKRKKKNFLQWIWFSSAKTITMKRIKPYINIRPSKIPEWAVLLTIRSWWCRRTFLYWPFWLFFSEWSKLRPMWFTQMETFLERLCGS